MTSERTTTEREGPAGEGAKPRASREVASVDLSTGVTLQYVEQGEPSGVPVLFLHGLSDSWHSFELVLPHLPGSVRAFALTQRGHGDSSRPEKGYGFRDYAADVAAFMDALELEGAVVVGHSIGSSIAKRFALDHPARTLGVVLPGSLTRWRTNPLVQELWNGVISTIDDPVDPDFVRAFQEDTLARQVPDAFLQTVVQESLKVPARVWKATVAGALEDDAWEELVRIEAPTLLVWGERDNLAPRDDQDAQVAAIPGARLTVYEGAGHGLHWEEPARFAADIARFVAERAR